MTPEAFLQAAARLAAHQDLTPLGAAILVALHKGFAEDSRTFARTFDVAHALVLRECTLLSADLHLLVLTPMEGRSQRYRYALTPEGRRACGDLPSQP